MRCVKLSPSATAATVRSPCFAKQPRLGPKIAGQISKRGVVCNVASIAPPQSMTDGFPRKEDGSYDLSGPPPFNLQDLRNAIPAHCFEKNAWRSMAHLALDVGIVVGLAAAALAANQCGHQSFSSSKALNDFVGHLTHSSILVPYHGWRISHRTHHSNHGHVENDESWHPMTKTLYEESGFTARLGRLLFPVPLLAYPFYLFNRSPGKTGSHFDPECDLFTEAEKSQVNTTNAFLLGFIAILAACTVKLGVLNMLNLYVLPYWGFVIWLDVVTYLHHHGPSDANEKMPWYRGEAWSYLRGGLTTIDRDYGIFNKIHHDIGTHVLHHLFPQIPHYHLEEATAAVKPVMGPYYREPEKSPSWFPFHLWGPLKRSFSTDHYVADSGEIVYYERDEKLLSLLK